MSISIIIIGIVIGGIATLVTVIFTIISLATGKNKNAAAWGAGFTIAICVLIISVFQAAKRIGEKVKTGVEWLEENKKNSLGYNGDSDNVEYYKQERQYFLDTLLKYTNESLKDKVPADFYANKPAEKAPDSSLIVPFVFPLSMQYNQGSFLGTIVSDINDSIYLSNISQIAFDENFAIAKVDNTNDKVLLKSGRGEIEYVLFDLRTREYLTFVSQQMLTEKARKIGYVGPADMSYLSELYRGWTESQSFDY